MPLARFKLRNEYGLGDPELYRARSPGKEVPKAILDGIAVAGLVGILRQLGDVAEFAAEIFEDLHGQVMSTAARGHRMLARMKQIESAFSFVEDAIRVERSFIDFAYETGCRWHTDFSPMETPVSCCDLPQFMIDSYEDCRDPPRWFLLDKYDSAGSGACLKRYSDPGYFKRAWEAKEPDKAVHIQREKKNQKIKKKYSLLKIRQLEYANSISQCKNSLGSSTQFLSVNNDGQSFTTENSSISETGFKSDALSVSPLLNSMTKLKHNKQTPEAGPSVMPDDLEYDRSSISNLWKSPEGSDVSYLQNEELVIGVDDDSQNDFLLRKSTSRSPSVIWDEKSEILKDEGPEVYDDTVLDRDQGSEPFLLNSESLEVHGEPVDQAKKTPFVTDFPASFCGLNQLDEVISEADNYLDALNTLESEGETESECQTKLEIQSLSNIGHYEIESGVAKVPQANGYSGVESPMALNGSAIKQVLPEDTNFDVLETLEHKLPNQEVGFSTKSCYVGDQFHKYNVLDRSRTKEADGDQSPCSNDPILETMMSNEITEASPYFHVSPLVNVPLRTLWTNGNLLGLEPSKPPAISLPSGARENSQPNSLNYGLKQEKANGANGQISKELISRGKAQETVESLSSADQSILNDDQFNSRRNVIDEINLKYLTPCLDCQLEGIPGNNYYQKQSEATPLSELEGAQTASSSISTTKIDRTHHTEVNAFDTEAESCCTSNVASQLLESAKNSVDMSSTFSELARRFLVHGLQRKPSVNHSRDSVLFEQMVTASQLQGKPPADKHMKRSNGVALQTFYERSFIGKAKHGSLKKSNSSSSPYENSSPPLEHMKISFHPMNGLHTSRQKPEFPDGNVKERIDGMMLPSFQMLSGCSHPVQDCNSESDDDTFCRSYPYSSEDLLSLQSDSNSELWEQDDMYGSNVNDLPDDLRRISSSTASISSSRVFEQNHVDQEAGLKDYCTENDLVSFQSGHFAGISGLDSFTLFRGHIEKFDSLSINFENSKMLPPTEQPPPPPLPPIQWRKLKPSNEVLEENDSNISKFVDYFEGLNSQTSPAFLESDKVMQWPPSLGEVGPNKKLPSLPQDNQKLNSHVQSNLLSSCNDMESRKEQFFHQIRDLDTEQNPKPYEPKSQVVGSKGVDEREDLLHQIRSKTFNLRRTSTSRPSFVPQPTTNVNVAAILEKANAIRQACACSDEGDDNDDWSEG